jgi:integrase
LPGRKKVYDDIDALRGSRAVQKWLEGMRAGPHRKTALYNLARYLRWRRARALEADPDRLIEECLNGNNQTLIRHLDALVEYCQGGTFQGSSLETRRKNFKDVVSFYRAHFITLPKARINGEGERAVVRTEVTASSFLAFVKTVLLKARLSPLPRAVILTMLQSGMDASTLAQVFNVYGYPQLVSHFGTEDFEKWDVRRCPVRVDLVRPKSQYRYYTFLDADAVDALKDWLRKRQLMTSGPIRIHGPKGPSELPVSDPIFIKREGGSITPAGVGVIFRQAGKRAGVNIPPAGKQWGFRGAANRYPFHSHEVRDTLVTLARKARADIVAVNFFVGHSIDKLKYDKSPWDAEEYFRDEYLKVARPYLNVISNIQAVSQEALDIEKFKSEFQQRLTFLEEQLREVLRAAGASPRRASARPVAEKAGQ